jgi:hypothetical protein
LGLTNCGKFKQVLANSDITALAENDNNQAALGIANATKENAMKETLSTELAAGP